MPSRSVRSLAMPDAPADRARGRRRWLDAAADAPAPVALDSGALAPVQALRPALRNDREAVLAAALQALPVAVVRFEADGSVDVANDRAAVLLQTLGLRPALRSGWALLETLDAPLARRARAALRQPGVVADRKPVFVRPAGQRPVELAVSVQVLDGRACLVTLEEARPSALRPAVG